MTTRPRDFRPPSTASPTRNLIDMVRPIAGPSDLKTASDGRNAPLPLAAHCIARSHFELKPRDEPQAAQAFRVTAVEELITTINLVPKRGRGQLIASTALMPQEQHFAVLVGNRAWPLAQLELICAVVADQAPASVGLVPVDRAKLVVSVALAAAQLQAITEYVTRDVCPTLAVSLSIAFDRASFASTGHARDPLIVPERGVVGELRSLTTACPRQLGERLAVGISPVGR